MRRILLDEGVPIGVRRLIRDADVQTVAEIGWAGLTNGDLINAAEGVAFDVIVTCDQSMRYQQNLTDRRVAIVVLTTNHWDTIRANSEGISPAIDAATIGSFNIAPMPRPARRRPHRTT